MIYRVSSGSFPTVTISKMGVGDKLYAERESAIASSPVYDAKTGKGSLKRGRLMVTELEGVSYQAETKPTEIGQLWQTFRLGTKQTIDRKRIGERSYVSYEALAPDQKVTFRACFPGTIVAWDVTPLSGLDDDDVYVYPKGKTKNGRKCIVKSIRNGNEKDRPHGTIMVVKGSFLLAQISVKAKVFHTKDVLVKRFSGTDDSFQKFTGRGKVFFEVHGELQEIPLYPGEHVDVWPGYLLGFTEGVSLRMKPAGDVVLRNEENNDYVIRLTAGEKGGYVYTHSVKVNEFFHRNDKKS